PAAPRAAPGDRAGGETAALLGGPQAVDAVGDHADDHPAAVEPLGAHEIGTRRPVALGCGSTGAHDGAVDGAHRVHPREARDRVERGGVDAGTDTAATGLETVDARAGPLERRHL